MTAQVSKAKKIKNFLWPIHKGENWKFIPMFAIFFLISFNYNILRTAKDTLIVTAPNSGAETIPFIKLWIMLPCAILITYIFTKVSSKYSRDKVFYTMLAIFVGFFLFFTFILYPIRETLHPTEFTLRLQQHFPKGMHGLLALVRNWTFTLFYVMSELWGTVILSVLFWGFANEVTTINEAKRFYSLFGVGANIASMISGRVTIYLSSNVFNSKIPYGITGWDQSIFYLTSAVAIIGFLMASIFFFLNKKLPKEEAKPICPINNKPKKVSMRTSFAILGKSKYLICIALIVLCYNVTINLVEVIWKNQIKLLHPDSSSYNIYMGKVTILGGFFATFIALFISGNFLRKFTWTFNAILPPLVVLITGSCFFSFFILGNTQLTAIAALCGTTPLALSVLFGTLQNCLARASKFTLFDATKEIAFIPLDKDSRIKGKAAIDGVGSRIGKSGGAVIHQGLLIALSTLAASAPYVGFIFLGFVGIWVVAVKALGKQFAILTAKEQETISLKEAKETISKKLEAQKAFVKTKEEALSKN